MDVLELEGDLAVPQISFSTDTQHPFLTPDKWPCVWNFFSRCCVSFLPASPEEDKVSPGNRAPTPAPLLVTALRTRADT